MPTALPVPCPLRLCVIESVSLHSDMALHPLLAVVFLSRGVGGEEATGWGMIRWSEEGLSQRLSWPQTEGLGGTSAL